MIFVFYSIIFLLGLCVGSFLNVVIFRLGTREGIVKKRSHCPKCGRTLDWHDLIPLASFFILRGRCRHCGKPISRHYPLVEATTGLLFVLIFYLNYELRIMNYGSIIHDSLFIIQLLCDWFIISCLIVIFVYDIRHYIIPNKIVFPAIVIALVFNFYSAIQAADARTLFIPFLSAMVAAVFFLLLFFITRGKGMGLGDAKLVFLMGLVLGWPRIIFALFAAFAGGALVGIGLLAAKRKTLKSQIPFGPFLAAATILMLFFGDKIASWCFAFLGF